MLSKLCWSMLFAALALPLTAQDVRPARQVVVDASTVLGPHSGTPLNTVGAGRANEGLRADWQQQLATVQKEIGFKYLRFHGLLSDDMGVYREDASGRPEYNFQYVDPLFDAMLALHIRPFVELSFMPRALKSGDKQVFWWNGNVTPPRDMKRWNDLIRALVTHWKERYGATEIESWYYEVWNEPNQAEFWAGTQQQYFDLYKNTAEDVKAVCASCRVGGPATADGRWEPEWLNYIAKEHAPADFLSTHVYGVLKGTFDEDGRAQTILSTKPDSIVNAVRQAHQAIARSATPQLELHFTEWSTSYTSTDYIHDQYISAPFILDKLRQSSPLTQSMSYWTFTDIFEEIGPRFTPFHGGFGLMNYEGIRKPSYFAYRFLAQLGDKDVATSDSQSWATRSSDGSVQALFWDYVPVPPPDGEADQVFYKKEQPSKPSSPALLKISGMKDGRYKLNVYRIGYGQNDAYTAYLRMGAPQQLTRDQVAKLKEAASGAPVESRTVSVKGGIYEERFEMRENDVVLVVLQH